MSLLFFFFFSWRKRVLFIGFPPVCHGFERRPEMFETVKNCYQECERWDQFKGRGHWADKICFAPPKVSTKFVSTNHCGRTEKQKNICLSLNVNHRDIQIEQYLNLGIQLKPKIHGSYNSCILSILSTDRYAASRGTNPLPSLFDCRIKMKYILAAFCLKTHISKASSNFVDWRIPSNRGL